MNNLFPFVGMKVDIYRNLTKKCWSIRSRQHGQEYGKVVGYADTLLIKNAHFVVNKKGHEKVLLSGHKNVHAFVRGILKERDGWKPLDAITEVSYNPFKSENFYQVKDMRSISRPQLYVYLGHFGKVWI